MERSPSLCILYEFHSGPWGGGNQFLKALRDALAERHLLEPDPERADILVVNSHHRLAEAARHKWRRPEKTVIHRIDGPVGLIRDRDHEVDRVLYRFNRAVASGTVFQSHWSRRANAASGLGGPRDETVIVNAPDPLLFHDRERVPLDRSRKLRLIATSWSPNPRKGFDVYQALDRTLDFSRFEMTFVGNSPVRFENIRSLDPLPSAGLADELRRHDIFVTGSRSDPCSNSLLEALHCGLPALALHDGGHPELVGNGGETFRNANDALAKLELIANDYERYRSSINLPSLNEVADRYVRFAQEVHTQRSNGRGVSRVAAVSAAVLAAALDLPIANRAVKAGYAFSARRSARRQP